MTSKRITRIAAAALVVGVAVAAGGIGRQAFRAETQALAAQQKTIAQLQARVSSLEARAGTQPDWTAIAAEVEPSVFTIATDNALGSGWVVRSDAGGSELLTNFHVIEDAWNAGIVTVDLRQADRTIRGTIVRVDRNDDLAVVHVANRLPVLQTLVKRPPLGATVMAVATAKLIGDGVEALGLGIPVQTACAVLVACVNFTGEAGGRGAPVGPTPKAIA